MKKLIFLRKGMIGDYSDFIKCKEYKNTIHNLIDLDISASGFKEIERRLEEETKEYSEFNYLITTYPALLNNHIWWNEEEAKWEIYFVENNELKNIQEYTEKELRQAHNIEKLYLSGGLD